MDLDRICLARFGTREWRLVPIEGVSAEEGIMEFRNEAIVEVCRIDDEEINDIIVIVWDCSEASELGLWGKRRENVTDAVLGLAGCLNMVGVDERCQPIGRHGLLHMNLYRALSASSASRDNGDVRIGMTPAETISFADTFPCRIVDKRLM
ncbi:hypothetical protein [Halosegnis longus]|uniref:hypothetical protein n=1 Tax=Halosegnis longus TaxID=2216012 RepID=UPI00129E4FAB|nr:hypothetical protein [Halosegnis longus]